MSIATLILGASGTGKSYSLRNLDPNNTLLIQCINKPLPFRAAEWKPVNKETGGSVYRTDDPVKIVKAMQASKQDVIVIDDYQATLINELMSRSGERSFDKFSDIGRKAWDIFMAAGNLAEHRRVYILAHTQTDDFGNIRMKTVGRLVDEKLVPEGYFTIVLRTEVSNGVYHFSTQTNGSDCCKSPVDMFPELHIENDIAAVDAMICDFYGVSHEAN